MSLEKWEMEKYKTPVDRTLKIVNDYLGRNLTQVELQEVRHFLRQRRLGEKTEKTNTPPYTVFSTIVNTLNDEDINPFMLKLGSNLSDSESEKEPIIENKGNESKAAVLEAITTGDIPTYMTGDAHGFSSFKEQTDKAAEKVVYYNAKDNRNLFDNRDDNSDAEIIVKRNDKNVPEDDKNKLFNVLHLYLKARGARGRSVTTIGIKIPEGVDPSPFMKKLAQEVYEADMKIGALDSKTLDWNEFSKRQDELKTFAQKQFLKYANEQILKKPGY